MTVHKLSMVIPVYNAEPFIERCLLSCTGTTGIEVIVVDDGSTDRSRAIIEDFVERDPSIFRLYNYSRAGASIARRRGVERASGDYIAFLDSDDLVDIERYAALFRQVVGHRVHIGMGRTCIRRGENSAPAYSMERGTGIITIPEKKILLCSLPSVLWGKIFSRTMLDHYDSVGSVNEDLECVPFMYGMAGTIFHTDEVVYTYIKRPGSHSGEGLDITGAGAIANTVFPLLRLKVKFVDAGLFDRYAQELEAVIIKHMAQRINDASGDRRIANNAEMVGLLLEILAALAPGYRNNCYYANDFEGWDDYDRATIRRAKPLMETGAGPSPSADIETLIDAYGKRLTLV